MFSIRTHRVRSIEQVPFILRVYPGTLKPSHSTSIVMDKVPSPPISDTEKRTGNRSEPKRESSEQEVLKSSQIRRVSVCTSCEHAYHFHSK